MNYKLGLFENLPDYRKRTGIYVPEEYLNAVQTNNHRLIFIGALCWVSGFIVGYGLK